MASQSSEVPIRAGEAAGKTPSKTKSRNSRLGCGECKAKRLKCDETKPACKQCVRRGRTCPGYQKQYRWSTVHEKGQHVDNAASFWPQNEHAALLGTLSNFPRAEHRAVGRMVPQHTGEEENAEISLSPLAFSPDDRTDIHSPPTATARSNNGVEKRSHPGDESTRVNQALDTASSGDGFAPRVAYTDTRWTTDLDITQDETSSLDFLADFDNPLVWRAGAQHWDKRINSLSNPLSITASVAPKILYTPVDLPTMLIEYWFTDVCPMWSAFDSPSNPNRKLAANSWQQSDAVFYAMQSMSAACLADSLPHLKKSITGLFSQAVEAIQRGVQARKVQAMAAQDTLPKDILLAILAMGTSVCWTDTRQLGLWFLGKAHELLDVFEVDSLDRDEGEQSDLLYFREALVYWEMLYRAIGWDSQNALKNRRLSYKRKLRQTMSWAEEQPVSREEDLHKFQPLRSSPKISRYHTLHPWTGVSADVQHTFGLVILLCRDRRMADRKQGARTAAALSDALCDIELARSFARELVNANFHLENHNNPIFALSYDTGDSSTPVSHLIDTAEAYRLSSILLLCQTFPDLQEEGVLDSSIGKAADDRNQHGMDGSTRLRHDLLTLTMRLVETLRRIPAESGTRCIQPLLYISAASGLRFDITEGMSTKSPANENAVDRNMTLEPSPSTGKAARLENISISSSRRPNDAVGTPVKSANLTTCTVEVSRARRFVIDRLCALQRTLPPKPIGVALDLVKAVWAEYDYDSNQSGPVHWIDIMVDNGLQTLFG